MNLPLSQSLLNVTPLPESSHDQVSAGKISALPYFILPAKLTGFYVHLNVVNQHVGWLPPVAKVKSIRSINLEGLNLLYKLSNERASANKQICLSDSS